MRLIGWSDGIRGQIERAVGGIIRRREVDKVVELGIAHVRNIHLGKQLREAVILLGIENRVVIETVENRFAALDVLLKLGASGLVEKHEGENGAQVTHG